MSDGDPTRHRSHVPSASWLELVALVAVLAALGWLAVSARRQLIRTFFRLGPPLAGPALEQPTGAADGLEPVARVRVLLVDGLGAEASRALPAHERLCQAGTDFDLDVGFPTVSLPVQAVLWTGRTQQQLGLLYRIAPLATPPPQAVAVRVSRGLAVAEDQPFIARSFGFEMRDGGASWSEFSRTALELAAGPAPLVFVHVLRVDKAGHRSGSASEAYLAAAASSDELLGRLLAVAPADGSTRWFVLSDHGHRPAGGHGGGEPGVRLVRACIAGGMLPLSTGTSMHLVDFSRALHDSLALEPSPGSEGRPLTFALTHPDRGRTLPRLGAGRGVGAGLVFLLIFLLARWRQPPQRTFVAGLLWPLVGYLGILVFRGLPTLSNPIVYPPLGRDIVLSAMPGLLVLAFALMRVAPRERLSLPAFCRVQLALPGSLAAACLVACGGVEALLSEASGPPLALLWTAHASVFLSVLAAGSLTLALFAIVAAVAERLRRFRRERHSR
jgi:Type I phosphodiesterase / nucleotide pyrophosphatase